MSEVGLVIAVIVLSSVLSSISSLVSGAGFFKLIIAQTISLFGGPSIETQAQDVCPWAKIDKTKASEYITGAQQCPPLPGAVGSTTVSPGTQSGA